MPYCLITIMSQKIPKNVISFTLSKNKRLLHELKFDYIKNCENSFRAGTHLFTTPDLGQHYVAVWEVSVIFFLSRGSVRVQV